MLYLLYDILLAAASLVVIPLSLIRGMRTGKYRQGVAERFGFIDPARLAPLRGGGPVIWVHAVSVGETIAAKPLLAGLKRRFPGCRILLSQVTETGREIADGIKDADVTLYFPFDFGFAVRRALRLVDPALVVIVETEIWPNFLRAARTMAIPVMLANGRISDRSFPRYQRFKRLLAPVLDDFASFCMQSDEDARRIREMGGDPRRITVARNLKYDLPAKRIADEERSRLAAEYRLPPGVPVIVAASTHAGEEETVIAAYQRLLRETSCLLILVPRHPPRRNEVEELLRREGMPFTRRTALEGRSARFAPGETLLVDTVGELMRLYACADLVFVGGSLVPVGGHNLLEPASLGKPTLFGPYTSNFREIASLVQESGAGVKIADREELFPVLKRLLGDEGERLRLGENAFALMERTGGSTELHLDVAASLLEHR